MLRTKNAALSMRGTKPAAPPSEGEAGEPGNEPRGPRSQSGRGAVTTADCTATHCCRRTQTGGQSKESIRNRIIPSSRFVATLDSHACVPLSSRFPRLTCAAPRRHNASLVSHRRQAITRSPTSSNTLARNPPPPQPPCHHSDSRPFLRDAPSRNMSIMMPQARMPSCQ